MSYEDISEGLAAELTGSVGVSDAPGHDESLPDRLANDVQEHDQYQAERSIPVSNDVQDTAAGDAEREAARNPGRKQLVPLGALQEERSKRQQREAELVSHQAQIQQLNQQLEQLQQYQQQAQRQAAEASMPQFSDDPEGYIKAREAQFEQRLVEVAQQQQNHGQAVPDHEAVVQQLNRDAQETLPAVAQAELQFEADHPDYRDAFEHVQSGVEAQLRQRYPQATEAEFAAVRTAAMVGFARDCQARGINPAEHVYNRARALGFNSGHQQAQQSGPGYQMPSNYSPRRPPTSLSNLAGAARAPDERGKMTASRVSEMSDSEFDDFFASMSKGSNQRIKF